MNKYIILLRAAYWVGILADAFMAVKLFLLPYFPGKEFTPELETVASLMIGWTILLFWADRKPVERKNVLLITIIMMIIGRAINIIAVIFNKIAFIDILINDIPPLIVLSFFVFVYLFTLTKLKYGKNTKTE